MRYINGLRPLLIRRKFQVFAVGAAKTGTTSIAHMMGPHIRSAHEPEVVNTTRLVIDFLEKKISTREIRQLLRSRDRRLHLELEASHPLGYLVPELVKVFPQAKFIITLREPLAWLRSRLNFHHYRTPSVWQTYRDYIWQRHFNGFAKQERGLEKLGLYSVAAYLRQYEEQYRILLNHLSDDQYVLIKTDQINTYLGQIADFLGVHSAGLQPTWSNRLEVEQPVIDHLDQRFVQEQIALHCPTINQLLSNLSP